MFFENEIVNFNILDVIKLNQTNINMNNSGRNFCALSFRIHSDTVLKSETNEYILTDNCISFVPARVNYTRVSSVDELIVIHFDIINGHTKDIEFFLPEKAENFKRLFEEILYCWNKKETGYKYKCSAIFYEILSNCHSQNFKFTPPISKIHSSVQYMLNHYKEPNLSIPEIANQSFVSEVYFRKLFKKEYGSSPQKYIVFLRIRYATELISTQYYSLKEVALMSGYRDYKYFSTEFKKYIGCSPSEYFYNFQR